MSTWTGVLEKRGRGRGLLAIKSWQTRKFVLTHQEMAYFQDAKQKGVVNVANATTRILPASEADGKPHGFEIDNGTEKFMLNAESDAVRQEWLTVIKLAAANSNWVKDANTHKPHFPTVTASAGTETEQQQKDRRHEEELEAKNLHDAHLAEEKRKHEHELQLMQMFKSMGAKLRFRKAKEMNHLPQLREAAACMIQTCARTRISYKKEMAQKKEQLRLEQLAYAKKMVYIVKLQCFLRSRLSSWRVAARHNAIPHVMVVTLKSSSGLNINDLATSEPYAYVSGMQVMHHHQYNTKTMTSLARPVSVIKGAATATATASPTASAISPTKAAIPTTVAKTAAPVAKAAVTPVKPAKAPPKTSLDHAHLAKTGTTMSLFRTANVTGVTRTTSPSWNEEALVAGVNGHGYIVITVLDKDSTIKDDCLGQAVISIADYPQLNTGATVELTLKLHNYVVPLTDSFGVSLATVRKSPKGEITVAVRIPKRHYTMCGWVWKVTEGMMTSAMKKRWFVLFEGSLQYYGSEYGLDAPKHAINCKDVTAISEEMYKGERVMKITYAVDGSSKPEFWLCKFDESEPAAITAMWMRKLFRNCPSVEDPFVSSLGLAKPVAAEAGAGAGAAAGTSGGDQAGALPGLKTLKAGAQKKRMSVFSK